MSVAGLLAGVSVAATLAAARVAARLPTPGEPQRPVMPLRLDELFRRAGVSIEPRRGLALWAGACGAGALAGAVLWGPAGALLLGAIVAVGPAVALWSARHRGSQLVEAELPEALDAIARSLRSGASLLQAVEDASVSAAGPLADDMRQVLARVAAGAPLAASLARWATDRPLAGVRLAVTALTTGAQAGGATGRAIEGVAATLRDRLAVEREVAALAAQGKASALVIAALPVGFLVIAASADAQTTDFLFRTRLGLVCLTGGLALEALGWLWMRRIIGGVR